MKRFSDTARFEEPWYRTLSMPLKAAWELVWAKCDNAGVWFPDFALADFMLGGKVRWEDLIEKTGRIVIISDGKWLIRGFVELQCGAAFSPDSRPHQAVMATLRSHGIPLTDSLSIDYPKLQIGYPKGIHTLQDKDKDKDPDKDKTQPREANPKSAPSKTRGTEDEVVLFSESIGLSASDGRACFFKWEGNGWTNGGNPIKDWRSTIRSWKEARILPKGPNGHSAPSQTRVPDPDKHF